MKVKLKNFLNTIESFLRNDATAPRDWQLMDRNGTLADTYQNATRGGSNIAYLQSISSQAPTTLALTINRLAAIPFEVKFPISITQFVVECTAGTSGNVRFGIYSDDGTLTSPSELLKDSGQITITAPGMYTANIALSLLPGIYWFAFNTDTANTFRACNVNAITPAAGLLPSSFLAVNMYWFVAKTYGALPNPFTAGGSIAGGQNFPIIGLKII